MLYYGDYGANRVRFVRSDNTVFLRKRLVQMKQNKSLLNSVLSGLSLLAWSDLDHKLMLSTVS